FSPLHYAVLGRMPEMVRILMEAGANARGGLYPLGEATGSLTIASERGYDDIAAIIREAERRRAVERHSVEEIPPELWTALREGSEDRALEVIQSHPELVRVRKADDAWTLLHAASALLFVRMAELLISLGADVNQPAEDGSTPLDVAGWRSGAARRA